MRIYQHSLSREELDKFPNHPGQTFQLIENLSHDLGTVRVLCCVRLIVR